MGSARPRCFARTNARSSCARSEHVKNRNQSQCHTLRVLPDAAVRRARCEAAGRALAHVSQGTWRHRETAAPRAENAAVGPRSLKRRAHAHGPHGARPQRAAPRDVAADGSEKPFLLCHFQVLTHLTSMTRNQKFPSDANVPWKPGTAWGANSRSAGSPHPAGSAEAPACLLPAHAPATSPGAAPPGVRWVYQWEALEEGLGDDVASKELKRVRVWVRRAPGCRHRAQAPSHPAPKQLQGRKKRLLKGIRIRGAKAARKGMEGWTAGWSPEPPQTHSKWDEKRPAERVAAPPGNEVTVLPQHPNARGGTARLSSVQMLPSGRPGVSPFPTQNVSLRVNHLFTETSLLAGGAARTACLAPEDGQDGPGRTGVSLSRASAPPPPVYSAPQPPRSTSSRRPHLL